MINQLGGRVLVLQHRAGIVAATCAAFVAVACGGGGGSGGVAGVGSGGTGFVTGFGSVIVDGVTYEDSALDSTGAVKSEDSTGDITVNRSVIRIGQRLELELSDDGRSIRTALLASELTGPVSEVAAVGATSFRVAGQLVSVNSDAAQGPITVFEGATVLSDFALNDRVEVHGELLPDGSAIRASRIERKPATDASGNAITLVKVSGFVRSLTAAMNGDRSFQVGSLTVNLASGKPVTPAAATLANGQRVKVFGTVAGTTMTADAVRVKRFNSDKGDFRLRGVVASTPAPTASSFVINGVTVDASSLNLASNFVVAGSSYRVKGVFASATNTLRASEVKASSDDSVRTAELKGSVSDYVSISNFRVRGVPVDASGVSGLTSLDNGEFVEVKGSPNAGGVVVATQLERKQAVSGNELEITSTLNGLNTASKTFNLGSRVVSYASATLEDFGSTQIADGQLVEVEGRLNGSTLNARKVELKGAGSSGGSSGSAGNSSNEDLEVEGRLAENAVPAGNGFEFRINGILLNCTSAAVGSACGSQSLVKGRKFEARYMPSGSAAASTVTRLKREDD